MSTRSSSRTPRGPRPRCLSRTPGQISSSRWACHPRW
ncbi:GS homeobox 2 [Prionailurus iriomotensis]